MGNIINVSSQKGGTGKTTTAVNLAASLALFEKRTLLVDCDPLGNATTNLGIDKNSLTLDLYNGLVGDAMLRDIVVPGKLDYLDLVPARFRLQQVESILASASNPHKECLLRQLLEPVSDNYDYIILDSPATLGYLTISALISSDWLLIPLQYQIFALEGLGQLLGVIKGIQAQHNPNLRIAGVLLTMCEADGAFVLDLNGSGLDQFRAHLFSTIIPWDRHLRDSNNFPDPLALSDITCRGAQAHLNLAREIMERLKQKD